LAINYSALGRDTEAHAEAAEILKLDPKFSPERFVSGYIVANKQLLSETLNDLRKAGVP
jgi:hypothetical protein